MKSHPEGDFSRPEVIIASVSETIQHLDNLIQQQVGHAAVDFTQESFDDLDSLRRNFQLLENQTQQTILRLAQLENLIEISTLLNSGHNVSQLFEKIIDSIVRLTGAERAYLMLRDENGKLTIAIARNWNRSALSADEVNFSRTVINEVLESGTACVLRNAQSDALSKDARSVMQLHFLSILCIPLMTNDKVIGVLYADNNNEQGVFDPDIIPLLTAFASQAAIALENAHLYEQLKNRLNSLDATRDAERRRLRNDLHDGIGPTLAAINLAIDRTRNMMSTNPARADELLLEVKTDVQQAIGVIRHVIEELRPPELEKGLLTALRERFARFNSFEAVRIEFIEPPFLSRISEDFAANLYLMTLEAVTNVVRHAHATVCRVEMIVENSGVTLSVEDDGRGFQPERANGNGIASIQERVQHFGGKISIDSKPGKGTCLLIQVPFAQASGFV